MQSYKQYLYAVILGKSIIMTLCTHDTQIEKIIEVVIIAERRC